MRRWPLWLRVCLLGAVLASPAAQAQIAGQGVSIQQAGTTISLGAQTLNFTSGATVTNCGPGVSCIAISGGGSGTVTSVGSGSGLTGGPITTSGTLALAAQSANTVMGSLTAVAPSGLAVPSCSATGDALIWTSATGFGCVTGYAPLASPTFSGTVTIPSGIVIAGVTTTGVTGTGNIALSASPTFSGTVTTGIISAAGSISGTTITPTGASPSSKGLYLFATNSLGFSANSAYAGDIDATQHWRIGGTGTPTITSGNCGTGTNGTIASGGNDQAFEVEIGSAATTTCTITFASAFTTAPREAQVTPANSAAAAIGTTGEFVSPPTTTTLVINGTALANANYMVQVQ